MSFSFFAAGHNETILQMEKSRISLQLQMNFHKEFHVFPVYSRWSYREEKTHWMLSNLSASLHKQQVTAESTPPDKPNTLNYLSFPHRF